MSDKEQTEDGMAICGAIISVCAEHIKFKARGGWRKTSSARADSTGDE